MTKEKAAANYCCSWEKIFDLIPSIWKKPSVLPGTDLHLFSDNVSYNYQVQANNFWFYTVTD